MAHYKMKDIAGMADVSVATVARVIHQNGYVSKENRVRIEKILNETGYVPNKIASGLKKRESMLIGHMTLFNINMLYERISDAVNQSAIRAGYYVLTLTSHRNRDEESRQVDHLIGQQVDGVIITSNTAIGPELVGKINAAGIPVVMIERTLDLPEVDCIVVDDRRGAFEAVAYLLERGHERIGYIGMRLTHMVERRRYQGYCDALDRAGISIDEKLICLTEQYSVEAGKACAGSLLGSPGRPTAIFATSDILAGGVLQRCYREGLRVPEDLSLIGYDNTLSSMLSPPVTSMALPEATIGDTAMRLLQRRRMDRHAAARIDWISPYLVERETVRQ